MKLLQMPFKVPYFEKYYPLNNKKSVRMACKGVKKILIEKCLSK